MGRHYLGPGASIANTMVFGVFDGTPRDASTSHPFRHDIQARVSRRSRRTVVHVDRAAQRGGDDLFLGRGSGVDDGAAIEPSCRWKNRRRLVHAVSRSHTHVAVDLDFEGSGAIVGSSIRIKVHMSQFENVNFFTDRSGPGRPLSVLRLGAKNQGHRWPQHRYQDIFMITGLHQAMAVYGDPA